MSADAATLFTPRRRVMSRHAATQMARRVCYLRSGLLSQYAGETAAGVGAFRFECQGSWHWVTKCCGPGPKHRVIEVYKRSRMKSIQRLCFGAVRCRRFESDVQQREPTSGPRRRKKQRALAKQPTVSTKINC